MLGPGLVKVVHKNQIDHGWSLLDSYLVGNMALDKTGLDSPDAVQNSKMNSAHIVPDLGNMDHYDPDVVSIEVVHLLLNMQVE